MNRRAFLAGTGTVAAGMAVASLPPPMLERLAGSVRAASQTPRPETWSDRAITIAWLGHATALINFYGLRILTDPALLPRIGVQTWVGTIGPLRLTACALLPEALPEIDLVLLSHAHFDHTDTTSLSALRGRPTVVTASKTGDLVPRRRAGVIHELRWDQSVVVRTANGDVEVTALEVNHWGARLTHDRYRGYNGYAIRREGRALLFGGDTAQTAAFARHRRHGPFEAALMPIGAYDPYIYNHCTPEQAVALANAAGARRFIPIHHKTFRLSDEPFDEPIERAEAALAREQDRLAIREVGETTVLT